MTKTKLIAGLLVSAFYVDTAVESPGKAVGDSWITTKVKGELVADKQVGATHIHVKTVEGIATPSGTAKSQAHIDPAVEDANNVKGVKPVVNNLEVKSQRSREQCPSVAALRASPRARLFSLRAGRPRIDRVRANGYHTRRSIP